MHLYCLAVNRIKDNGEPLLASDRNNYHFHIRHFVSSDKGLCWMDKGAFQRAAMVADGHDARNVWSGSILPLDESRLLAAYTGIREAGEDHPFVQNLAVGISTTGDTIIKASGQVLLCPVRDEIMIRAAGYYLSDRAEIGAKGGEAGGPILAWRDPYVFKDASGQLNLAWAAKSTATTPALGLASVIENGSGFAIDKLLPPVALPDDHLFSQFELPKIYFDDVKQRYLLIAATTTRESESQSDEDVVKKIRLYVAENFAGPWRAGGVASSEIFSLDTLFGMTVISADFTEQKILCMAPFTEAASIDDALSFAPVVEIDISGIDCVDQLSVK